MGKSTGTEPFFKSGIQTEALLHKQECSVFYFIDHPGFDKEHI
jgi:hypothetical protein